MSDDEPTDVGEVSDDEPASNAGEVSNDELAAAGEVTDDESAADADEVTDDESAADADEVTDDDRRPNGADAFGPVAFLDEAVRIPSHEDVGEMRSFLVETLADRGVEATVDDAGNVLAERGSGRPHVVLNTHIDTVSPHVPRERDGDAIRGRGSCDAKGPLAALLAAFFAVDLTSSGDGADEASGTDETGAPTGAGTGRVTLAVTPDEETLSTGAHALVEDPDGLFADDPDAVIVGEPTGLDACTAAKGRFEGTVRLSGTTAHAAEPESGANAVAAAGDALAAIGAFDVDREAHPSLGRATLTPTVIRGGGATNQVPADCAITVDRRSVPPETAEGFAAELRSALREAVPEGVGVEFAFADRETPFLEAFATDESAAVVRALSDAAAAASDAAGLETGGDVRPFAAATEASYFAARAPTVVFGPGVLADGDGAVAHADREYVRIPEVRAAADALTRALGELVTSDS